MSCRSSENDNSPEYKQRDSTSEQSDSTSTLHPSRVKILLSRYQGYTLGCIRLVPEQDMYWTLSVLNCLLLCQISLYTFSLSKSNYPCYNERFQRHLHAFKVVQISFCYYAVLFKTTCLSKKGGMQQTHVANLPSLPTLYVYCHGHVHFRMIITISTWNVHAVIDELNQVNHGR